MHSTRQAVLIALLMMLAAITPYGLMRSPLEESGRSDFSLEELIPAEFGEWRVAQNRGAYVVNPEAQQLLDKLYSQVLTRTYVAADGYSIMLSIAVGDNQSGGLKAHMPDLCYPAQGFVVTASTWASIESPDTSIPVNRLEARMGSRTEPITYWFKLGDRTLGGKTSIARRMVEARFALGGKVPDGLLFRASSIDNQRHRAFTRQEKFATDLLAAVGPSGRERLIGSGAQ